MIFKSWQLVQQLKTVLAKRNSCKKVTPSVFLEAMWYSFEAVSKLS